MKNVIYYDSELYCYKENENLKKIMEIVVLLY